MGKYDYPELIKRGTVVGPVTVEMRRRCQEKLRAAKRYLGETDDDLSTWPDFLPLVRREMDGD